MSLSTIEKQAIREICENPFDDTPRLIYADWLEEQGRNERAEFIRLGIEWEKIKNQLDPDCPNDPMKHYVTLSEGKTILNACVRCWAKCRGKQNELLMMGKTSGWFVGVVGRIYLSSTSRGFIVRVPARLDPGQWRNQGKMICRYNPIEDLTHVGVYPGKETSGDLSLWFWSYVNQIPWWVKDLPGSCGRAMNDWRIYYKSYEDATRSLHLALINHARRQLKMPDLDWKST